MNTTPPSAEQVLDDLGDKVVHTFGKAVAAARADLETYRDTFPSWVAQHGERGLANWISDRVWHHVTVGFEGIDEVILVERGVRREVSVRGKYRLRIKRHHLDGDIRSYPTQTALEFLAQPSGQIPGLEDVHLASGYRWDRSTREMGAPLLSLRDGRDNVRWIIELPETATEAARVVGLPQVDGPSGPEIVVDLDLDADDQTESGS